MNQIVIPSRLFRANPSGYTINKYLDFSKISYAIDMFRFLMHRHRLRCKKNLIWCFLDVGHMWQSYLVYYDSCVSQFIFGLPLKKYPRYDFFSCNEKIFKMYLYNNYLIYYFFYYCINQSIYENCSKIAILISQ